LITERILVPKTPFPFARDKQRVEAGNGLHHLHAVGLVRQSLVHLQEGNDVLDGPQVIGRAAAFHVAVHRLLEQDRAEDAVAVESRGSSRCACAWRG
jgi:hypothetical protein